MDSGYIKRKKLEQDETATFPVFARLRLKYVGFHTSIVDIQMLTIVSYIHTYIKEICCDCIHIKNSNITDVCFVGTILPLHCCFTKVNWKNSTLYVGKLFLIPPTMCN